MEVGNNGNNMAVVVMAMEGIQTIGTGTGKPVWVLSCKSFHALRYRYMVQGVNKYLICCVYNYHICYSNLTTGITYR